MLLLQGCRLSGQSRNPRIPTLRDGRSIHPTGNSPDVVFPAKAGIHVPPPSGTAGQSILPATPQMSSFRPKPESTYPHPPNPQGRQVNPSYRQLPRCRLSGESRNPRIPNPQGQKVNSSLRATPQMSSFRRKPESTYPHPQGRRVNPAYGQLPRCRLSGESRNPRTLNPEVRQVNASPRATPEVAEAHSRQSTTHFPPYKMPLRQLAGVQTRETTWIPANAGMTGGMTLPTSRGGGQLLFPRLSSLQETPSG